ncbi:Ribose import ATP-binding protein RbsA [Posidoniimonas corsicana]|uniref:Ribose import ATP-binding protein RbsA n=1 Tax=Posidoniimonas corsicana TaxID=1938618 RepID=A0A5C5VBQ0_9BACT|nr:sugar ABC transporter ATP-binding protein [Posidoniimonas corsicana]TWT35249.1 Ribose import ATP-binding protein RbsA [Posidoniimonas corsicana]
MTHEHAESPIVLAGEAITKKYPGVLALDQVDFAVRRGEVHGLIGENGAGKSTLMQILAGAQSPDGGVIRINGKPISFANPRKALDHGIALVYQELNLVPHMTVAENIFLGRELVSHSGFVRSADQIRQCKELLAALDETIDPCIEVGRLRVGQQQVVEIAKAIISDARVIFMDEPTSALSDHEAETLFKMIRSLRQSGVSIVYVSHKLNELLDICERITVLRDGKYVDTLDAATADRDTIVRLMVGRQLDAQYVHSPIAADAGVYLKVESLTLLDGKARRRVVDDVSFSVRIGEVFGVFGLMGAGRTEMLEALFGLHPARTSGTLTIDGVRCAIKSPAHAIRNGLGLVPEDRKHQGLVLGMSVEHNISLSVLPTMETTLLLRKGRESNLAQGFVSRFSIRTPTIAQRVGSLSGGNQQKVVLSKVLSTRPQVLMLDEPTRGIDVNAKREIYALIDQAKRGGMAVLVVSSELPELLGIADRIMVLCEGRKTGQFDRDEANEVDLLRAAVPCEAQTAALL